MSESKWIFVTESHYGGGLLVVGRAEAEKMADLLQEVSKRQISGGAGTVELVTSIDALLDSIRAEEEPERIYELPMDETWTESSKQLNHAVNQLLREVAELRELVTPSVR